MRTLIRGARIADCRRDAADDVLDVLIDGDTIAAVGAVPPVSVDLEIDGRGKAVIPGLVNAHTHSAMVLLRGHADDLPLRRWLEERIWPAEKHLRREHVLAGARLACLEMLKNGTTAFNDMYFFPDAVAEAAESLGLRAAIASVFFDKLEGKPLPDIVARLEAGVDALRARRNVVPVVGPHAPYTCSAEGLAAAARLAEKHGIRVHTHLAETEEEAGGSLAMLDAAGLVGPNLIAAHGIWLAPREMRTLGARGATIVHCPRSNMKLGSGRAKDGRARALDHGALRDAGVNLALGTDGAASANNLDLFEEMRAAALLQKHATGDPTALAARDAFAMATLHGARALGIDAGLIEPGRLADLVLVDLSRPYLCPGHDLVSDLVYAARGDCVDTVLVAGRVVMQGGRVPGEDAILAEARAAARDLVAGA